MGVQSPWGLTQPPKLGIWGHLLFQIPTGGSASPAWQNPGTHRWAGGSEPPFPGAGASQPCLEFSSRRDFT